MHCLFKHLKKFQLEYVSGQKNHPFLNKFKLCSLTDMAVNYTASGTYATYEDRNSDSYSSSMYVQRDQSIYAEDYEPPGYTGPSINPDEALISL